ncbi:hypothetical protein Mal33_48820 [Rosistilla oblonga]|uniref:Uncharacterized protein n=1 Tax=Rosistilla oblonga TaxID=2527990 RepID=A0A518J0I6_9BACT|nr:hypothetical protein Mal33_48820 [Rosistilla oblonga]
MLKKPHLTSAKRTPGPAPGDDDFRARSCTQSTWDRLLSNPARNTSRYNCIGSDIYVAGFPITMARKFLADPTVTRWYHCISRCVRQALLLHDENLPQRPH